jgi:hypothetical protein
MLNRTISSPTWTPSRWSDWRRGLSDRQAAMVGRYVLMVAVLSALGCIYLWQVNLITELRQRTGETLDQLTELEAANVSLMQQLAQWESPSHIDQAARAAGWQRVDTPMVVQVPFAAGAQASNTQVIASTQFTR